VTTNKWEEELRTIVVTAWLNYAKRIDADDSELEIIKGVLDLSTIQIADYINQNFLPRDLVKKVIEELEREADCDCTPVKKGTGMVHSSDPVCAMFKHRGFADLKSKLGIE
jgi:hypothetical protein